MEFIQSDELPPPGGALLAGRGGKVLRAAGCGFQDVVQCTAYIAGVEHGPAFKGIYADVFGTHKPARAVVPAPGLHYGFPVEVQLVAQRPTAG